MRHEGPFFLFKSEKKTDEGQLKQMRQVPENLFFFFFGLIIQFLIRVKSLKLIQIILN